MQTELEIDGHKLIALPLESNPDGPLIILIHGVLVSARSWLATRTPFFTHGRCVSLSLPGHYPAQFPSSFNWTSFNGEAFVRVMTEACKQIAKGEKFIVAGVSTGAMAALGVAAQLPEQVRAAVSISGFADGVLSSLLGWHQRTAQFALGREILTAGYAAFRFPPLFPWVWKLGCAHPSSFDKWPARKKFLDITAADFRKANLNEIAEFLAALRHMDIREKMSRVKCPVLMMAGQKDPIVPFRKAQDLAGLLPQAQFERFPEVGHLIFAEAPDEFNRRLNRWLTTTLAH